MVSQKNFISHNNFELYSKLVSCFSFDAELHLVHYNSVYDNFSHAVSDGQPNSLSVVGILIKEVTEFDQFNVQDSESIKNLKMAAQYLARPHKGPGPITTDLTVRPAEFIMDIGYLHNKQISNNYNFVAFVLCCFLPET